jgi:hypothetical protein
MDLAFEQTLQGSRSGGSFVADRPTLIGVGEAGPEAVSISPIGRAGHAWHVHLEGATFASPEVRDHVIAEFERRIEWFERTMAAQKSRHWTPRIVSAEGGA